jgi:hypothetical protein
MEKLLRNGAEHIANYLCNTVYIEVSKRQIIIKSKYNQCKYKV